MIWDKGRQLVGVEDNYKTISYTYDAQGRRTSKTVNGVTTTFTYSGSLLMRQSDGTTTLDFQYDAGGNLIGYKEGSQQFVYGRNAQGDIVRTYDMTAALLRGATFEYTDAWGMHQQGSGAISNNPFRYRGYYYDEETGFYFLQSRYYDPQMKRFLNADSTFIAGDALTASNMYAYCDNNPVNLCDPSGMASWWVQQGLTTMNEIHNVVVGTYVAYLGGQGNSVYTNSFIRLESGKKGFADLLVHNGKNGNGTMSAYIWEVKSMQNGNKEITKGREQLTGYVKGQWGDRTNVYLYRGWDVPEFDIVYTNGNNTYYINTYNQGNGMIGYTYQKFNPSREAAKDAFRKNAVPVVVAFSAVAFFWPVSGISATAATVIKALEILLAA